MAPPASDQTASTNVTTKDSTSELSDHAKLLASALRELKNFDLEIKCGELTWRTHRGIVGEKSSFFEKAITGDWLEAATGTIILKEEDPELVEKLLVYLYTSRYTDVTPEIGPCISTPLIVNGTNKKTRTSYCSKHTMKQHGEDLRAHVALYRVGDRYGVRSLVVDASNAFREIFQATLGGRTVSWGLNGEEYEATMLEIYESGSPGMRELAKLHFVNSHNLQSTHCESVKALVASNEEIAADIMDIVAGHVLKLREDWDFL